MIQNRFPDPFEIQNADGIFPAVCIVEHARNYIPSSMDGLGVASEHLSEHIAWDIGIEGVTRIVSETLDIPSIYCTYSRLIVDPNRPEGHPQMFWPESDGIAIPGNKDVGEKEREQRLSGIYHPYHKAAGTLVDAVCRRHGGSVPVLSMHSCTPHLRNGPPRPWHVGLSTYESDEFMEKFAMILRAENMHVGIHEPYDTRDYFGTSVDRHGREKGLPHLLVEIRQDLIGEQKGIGQMADVFIRAFTKLMR